MMRQSAYEGGASPISLESVIFPRRTSSLVIVLSYSASTDNNSRVLSLYGRFVTDVLETWNF